MPLNRFNRGIARVKVELKENGNPEPVFDYDKIGVFGVIVYSTMTESIENKEKFVLNDDTVRNKSGRSS